MENKPIEYIAQKIFLVRGQKVMIDKDLAQRMDKLELEQKDQGQLLASVYSIVKQLIDMPVKWARPIGFESEAKNKVIKSN
jgi:hypothetical protein